MTAPPTPTPALPALDVPDPLPAFLASGALADGDVRLAVRLAALTGEDDPQALLAAALALRAPRHGHVCVDLDDVAERIAVDPHGRALGRVPPGAVTEDGAPVDVAALPWPDPPAWREALRRSPMVSEGASDSAPLVLDGRRLYLDRYWQYERGLADRLARRAADPAGKADPKALRAGLDRLFGPPGEALDRQRLAAAVAALRRLTIVAGGPGTGKTYTITRLLALLHLQAAAEEDWEVPRVALAAPTGKAAARLQESLREALASLDLEQGVREALARTPSFTLHRLLGWRPDRRSRFRHDADHPLPHDVVIVDEASMVSLALMAKLVDAVRPDARLVLVGDRDQLASVEAGAAFGDACGPAGSRPTLRLSRSAADELAAVTGQDVAATAETAPSPGIWDGIVRLDRFHRFGERSGISAVAAAVQRSDGDADEAIGLLGAGSAAAPPPGAGRRAATGGDDLRLFDPDAPEGASHAGSRLTSSGAAPTPAADDVSLLDPDADERAREAALDAAVGAYAEFARLAVEGADARAVLAALGSLRVLCALRRGPEGVRAWNEAIEARLAAAVPGFRPDDGWYVGRPVLVTENDYAVKLHNGDVGVILADQDRPGRRVAVFEAADGSLRTLSPARLPATETTYAMTIHKSQGSQFDHAVVVLPSVSSAVLTRELIYTGITRARLRATILAREPVLREALARPVQRASGLADRLWAGGGPG